MAATCGTVLISKAIPGEATTCTAHLASPSERLGSWRYLQNTWTLQSAATPQRLLRRNPLGMRDVPRALQRQQPRFARLRVPPQPHACRRHKVKGAHLAPTSIPPRWAKCDRAIHQSITGFNHPSTARPPNRTIPFGPRTRPAAPVAPAAPPRLRASQAPNARPGTGTIPHRTALSARHTNLGQETRRRSRFRQLMRPVSGGSCVRPSSSTPAASAKLATIGSPCHGHCGRVWPPGRLRSRLRAQALWRRRLGWLPACSPGRRE